MNRLQSCLTQSNQIINVKFKDGAFMNKKFLLIMTSLFFILSACGGEATQAGDPARGESLYKQATIGSESAPGCVICHSLEPGETLVGPSYAGLARRAEDAAADKSAAEFLRDSIIDPDAEISEGFFAGVMYQNYGDDLSEQDIDDLVAFLLTQK
jgi:cytochrome c551/c552